MYTKKKQHNTKQNKTFPDPEPHLPPLMKRESKFERKHVHNATELKLLLATLLLLCSVATLLQFIPLRFTNISPSNLHLCISSVSQQPPPPFTSHSTLSPSSSSNTPLSTPSSTQLLPNGTIKRAFIPYGSAAYNFITMGAYRGGTNTFAIVGLSSKPLHVYGKPTYECEWIPFSSPKPIITMGYKIIPDIWGYDHVYTAVVVNCTFNHTIINGDNNGGKLVLYASTSGAGDTNFNLTDRIEVLQEAPNTLDVSLFVSEPKYDYFYCGSPLYGDLSPQRVREWITYHVWLFGPRSHFVIYDAGGVHEEVLEVLKPWMELGFVTLQDIRDQERFDGYLHNQFMVVNDCLHRYKFMAKWMFFFDVDEYIYVPPNNTIKTVVDSLSKYDQFIFNMMPMNNKICLYEDYGKTCRKWGFEKLVYRDSTTNIRRNKKYAVQPRSLYATGVHFSQHLAGKTYKTEDRMKYFHYHGIIAKRRESCKIFATSTQVTQAKITYVIDTTMRDIARVIKKFEFKMIGSRLEKTRQ